MKHAESVFEQETHLGEWWLPNNPDHKVAGTLRGSVANGFQLDLIGSLDPDPPVALLPDDGPRGRPPIICGKTFSGLFTLFESFSCQSKFGSHGLHTCTYQCTLVSHADLAMVDSEDKLHFRKIVCGFSVLSDWINAKVFDDNYLTTAQRKRGQFEIRFSLPAEATIYKNDHYSIKLFFRFSGPKYRIGQNDLTIEWEPAFVIESKGKELPWHADDDLNYSWIVNVLSQLLAVATYGPCYPFDIQGYSRQFEQTVGSNPEKRHMIPITIYPARRYERAKFDTTNMLFAWQTIEATSQACLEKWLSSYRMIGGPVSLFVDSLTRGGSYSPERFFNLVVAMEGLHRFANREADKPTDAHKQKLKEIVASVPEDYRCWVSEALALSHQPSLRKRLRELTKPFREEFDWLVGNEGNAEAKCKWRHAVLKAIARARNTLGHSLPDHGNDPGMRYYYFTGIAEFLIAMCLMKELGIDGQLIRRRAMSNFQTSQFRKRLVKFLKHNL